MGLDSLGIYNTIQYNWTFISRFNKTSLARERVC